jgi:hypothetical protein
MRGVKAAFVSLLVRREKAVVPSTEAGANKNGGILRSSQVYGDCEEPLEKLKEQWTQFMHETFLAIAELEMKLRREELESRFKTQGRRDQQPGPMPEWSN